LTDLSTVYMGLQLPNPIVVGSSGLTQSVQGVRKCAAAGAGAVVLESLFEEQILAEIGSVMEASEKSHWHPEAADYIAQYGTDDAVGKYLKLIEGSKKEVSIPVIASVHCVSAGAWTRFAKDAQDAGADALELNVFVLPADPRRDGRSNEQVYFDILSEVKKQVTIPVAIKLGWYFSGLSNMVETLGRTADALVLFNRFYRLDFDIEQMSVVNGNYLSHSDEAELPMRWVSILAEKVKCDLAASTGIHDGATVVKQLLAGAQAVEVCSVLYRKEIQYLQRMVQDVQDWMERHDFSKPADFRGRMSQGRSGNPVAYERVQFMKHSVGLE
jgi:dihydroorotate dehydrogenase (fumarate)